MTDSDFEKMTDAVRPFPGPELFLVSGYEREEIKQLTAFLQSIGYPNAAVKFCTEAQLNDTLESVLNEPPAGEPAGKGKLPNTMVFSGMTRADVQTVISRFKECGLPRPIFATTTPSNLSFKVRELLRHLIEEQRAAIGR